MVALLPVISVSQFTLRTSPSSGRGLRNGEVIKFQVGEIIEIEALVQCHGEATPGSYEVVLQVNGEIFDSLTVDRPDECGVWALAPFTLSFRSLTWRSTDDLKPAACINSRYVIRPESAVIPVELFSCSYWNASKPCFIIAAPRW